MRPGIGLRAEKYNAPSQQNWEPGSSSSCAEGPRPKLFNVGHSWRVSLEVDRLQISKLWKLDQTFSQLCFGEMSSYAKEVLG